MPLPDICVENMAGCPNEWPTLRLQQMASETVTVQLRDYKGHIYELDPLIHTVCLVTKQLYWSDRLDLIVDTTIIDGPEGMVEVSVTEDQVIMPGVFLGEFILFDTPPTAEGSSSGPEDPQGSSSSSSLNLDAPTVDLIVPAPVLHRFPAYVEVQISVENLDPRYVMGSLTIAELRMGIMDKCAADNFLLDHVQFSDTEIAWAIRRPLDLWNEHPPRVGQFSPSTFPYRYYWLNGAVGELLSMAGMNEERNRLKYAAANLAVDDKESATAFTKLGQALKQEYFQWMLREKKRINMEKLYGTTNLRAYGNKYYRSYPYGLPY